MSVWTGRVDEADGPRALRWHQMVQPLAADSPPGIVLIGFACDEGVRRNNFLGTSLIGPILIVNPYLTRGLLERLDPDTEPVLAHEALAIAAYEQRLADFRDPKRWHPFERVGS